MVNGQLATVSADATVRLWDLDTGAQLFALRLPADRSPPVPAWDFDFRCTPKGCWLAVPLTRRNLALYDLGPYAEGGRLRPAVAPDPARVLMLGLSLLVTLGL